MVPPESALVAPRGPAPRTSFGRPSLEGVWSTLTATPLERPPAFDGPTTTEERAAAFIADNVTKPVVGYVAGFTAPEATSTGTRCSQLVIAISTRPAA